MYFPTSWDSDDLVDELYTSLSFLLAECRQKGITPIIAGDFNASVGEAKAADPVDELGTCGCGVRNDRGDRMIMWVLEEGLRILSRHADSSESEQSWTCRRASDGSCVQLDFICAGFKLQPKQAWCDDVIAV